jgi:hypothetical protein
LARITAVQRCVANPTTQFLIVAQCASYVEPEEPSISIDETWSDAAIATVPVNKDQSVLSHLPRLLQEFGQDAVPNNGCGMIAVKVDLHNDS